MLYRLGLDEENQENVLASYRLSLFVIVWMRSVDIFVYLFIKVWERPD
jgi:hypothetical protein